MLSVLSKSGMKKNDNPRSILLSQGKRCIDSSEMGLMRAKLTDLNTLLYIGMIIFLNIRM